MKFLYYAYFLSSFLNFYILCIAICLILQLALIAILIYKEQLALFLTLLFAFLVIANIILSTFAKLYFWYTTFYHFGFEQGLKMLFYELIKPFYLAIDFDISCSVVDKTGRLVPRAYDTIAKNAHQIKNFYDMPYCENLLKGKNLVFVNLLNDLGTRDPNALKIAAMKSLLEMGYSKKFAEEYAISLCSKAEVALRSGSVAKQFDSLNMFKAWVKQNFSLYNFESYTAYLQYQKSLIEVCKSFDEEKNLTAFVCSYADLLNKVKYNGMNEFNAGLSLYDPGAPFNLAISNQSHPTAFGVSIYSYLLGGEKSIISSLEKKQGDFIMIKEVDGVYLPVTYVELKSLNNVDNGALLSGEEESIEDIARKISGVFEDKQFDAVPTDFSSSKKILIYIPGITATEAELIGIADEVDAFFESDKAKRDPNIRWAQFKEFKNNGGSVQIITDKRINFDNDLD